MISSICYEKLYHTYLWYSTIWRIIVIIHYHPYDSLYINYHIYFSINRFLVVIHPLIWIVTMIIRYDLICDCINTNYQILSPLLISIILPFSLFITICIGFISIPHYLTKLIFIIIVVQNGTIVCPYSKSSYSHHLW